jgi:hypothetical protein
VAAGLNPPAKLAILRSVIPGLGARRYLLGQATVITALVSLWRPRTWRSARVECDRAGLTMEPEFDLRTIALGLTAAGAVMAGGTILPALWVGRMNLARLLRVE